MATVKSEAGGSKAGQPSKGNSNRSAPAAAKGPVLPPRPNSATDSRERVQLLANYFDLTFSARPLTVYKYNFKVLGINNKEIRGATAKDIFKSALGSLGVQPNEYATDFQHQIVTLKPLKISGKDKKLLNIERFERCTIQFADPVPLQLSASVLPSPSPDVIDCLNLIMGQWAREQNKIATIGRHRFFKNTSDEDSEHHLETGIPESLSVVRGFFQSVRPAEDKLLLNANSTIAVFRPAGNIGKICRDLLKEKTEGSAVLTADLIKLHGAISKARVRVSYELPNKSKKPIPPVRVVRIAGLARKDDKDTRNKDLVLSSNAAQDFPGSKQVGFWIQGKYRTVWDHFKAEYGLDIESDVPLVNIGKPSRPEYVPAAYCELIWGQPSNIKATEIPGLKPDKLEKLDEFTCQPPESSRRWIESVHNPQELNLDPGTNQVLSSFRICVKKELSKVTGSKLGSPHISYDKKKSEEPSDRAAWDVPRRPLNKVTSGQIRWTWLYFRGDSQDGTHSDVQGAVKKLHLKLLDICDKGLQLVDPVVQDRCVPESEGIAGLRASLARIKARPDGIRLVVIICSKKLPADTYAALKFFGDIQIGIHTSCIMVNKFTRRGTLDGSYFSNVSLKINLKLGGTNHMLFRKLDLTTMDPALMVIGYDVSHPTGDEDNKGEESSEGIPAGFEGSKPSLEKEKSMGHSTGKQSQGGLVISVDDNLGQWLSAYWNQRPRKEMTDETLMEAFMSLLTAWKAKSANSKKKSFNVVIYRDGVSESQFGQILEREVPNIRQAYKKVFPFTLVKITLVVAIKRHTTRFFPADSQGSDSKGNIKPGIVVDNGVTQPKYWEFFLAAHFALKGTAKPTRYVVILDEIFEKTYKFHPNMKHAAQLEKFTHDVSYLFGRATNAVSVCTPAYYADILCTRARAYMAVLANRETRSEIEQSIKGWLDEDKKRVLAGRIHPLLENSMYWI